VNAGRRNGLLLAGGGRIVNAANTDRASREPCVCLLRSGILWVKPLKQRSRQAPEMVGKELHPRATRGTLFFGGGGGSGRNGESQSGACSPTH